MIDILYWQMEVLMEKEETDLFIKVFELLGYPPKIIVADRFMTALRLSYDTNCIGIFKYLME